ncbi:MAG: TylF/MycF/NovP-related O-methyltransferase [Pseudomonadota bacterium]
MLKSIRKSTHLLHWLDIARRWPLRLLLDATDLELTERQANQLTNKIHSWRQIIPPFLKRFGQASTSAQVYCFGVAHGETVEGLASGYRDHDLPLPHFHLFDSFQGLPEEAEGVAIPVLWEKGAFAAPKTTLLGKLEALELPEDTWSIHEGWFSETLKSDLVADGTFKPAAYVDVDGDLYSSTFDCLDFLFKHRLIRPGTIIGYDDWGDTDIWTAGESRAHKEMLEKYGMTCAQLFSWGQRPLIRKAFLVVSVGETSLLESEAA